MKAKAKTKVKGIDSLDDFFDRHEEELRVTLDVRTWRLELIRLEKAALAKGDDQAHVQAVRSWTRGRIHKAFRHHFKLRPNKKAGDFKNQCLRDVFPAGALDHCSYYSKKGALLIVTQPYDTMPREVKEPAEKFGALFVDVSKWGWHYPGRARCFLLIFPKTLVDRLKEEGAFQPEKEVKME